MTRTPRREVDTVAELVQQHLPAYRAESVVAFAVGLDHRAHEVNNELIVRIDQHRNPALLLAAA